MKILLSRLMLVTWLLFLAFPAAALGDDYYGVSVSSIKNAMEAAYLHDGYPETSFGDGWLDDSYIDGAFLKTKLFPDIPTSTLEVGDIILPLYVQYVTANKLVSKPDVFGQKYIDFESWFEDADLQNAWARVAARKDLLKGLADIAKAVSDYGTGQENAANRDILFTALNQIASGVPSLSDVKDYIVSELVKGESPPVI